MLKSDSVKSEYRIMAQLFKRSYFLKTICQAIALGSLFLFFQTPTFSSGHPEGYHEFEHFFDPLDPHTKLNGYTYTRKPKAYYETPLRFKHTPGARVGREIQSFPAKLSKFQRDLMVPDVFPARTNTSENKIINIKCVNNVLFLTNINCLLYNATLWILIARSKQQNHQT